MRRRGAVIVQVALALTLLLAAAAFTVDYGSMVVAKRRLQNVTDAAALAGGSQLGGPVDDAGARQRTVNVATSTAQANGVDNPTVIAVNNEMDPASPTMVRPYSVTVTATRQIPAIFAGVISRDYANGFSVSARSVVRVYPVQQMAKLAPLALVIGDLPSVGGLKRAVPIGTEQRYRLFVKDDTIPKDPLTEKPWFEPLAPDGGEAAPYAKYKQYLKYGYPNTLNYDTSYGRAIPGQSGDLRQVQREALASDDDSLLNRAGSGAYGGQTWDSYTPDNPRIIFIPIVGTVMYNPKGSHIFGFAAFYIEEFNVRAAGSNLSELRGRFVPSSFSQTLESKPGSIDPTYYNFGVYQYQLEE